MPYNTGEAHLRSTGDPDCGREVEKLPEDRNMGGPDRAFQSIYPDINPATALGATTAERLGFAVSTGILAFGGVIGDLLIAGAGAVLVLFSVIGASMKTPRRIRNEARNRFPQQDWVEYQKNHTVGMFICWLAIITIVALMLFLVPVEFRVIGAGLAAVIAASIIWLSPGISPVSQKRQRKRSSEPGSFKSLEAVGRVHLDDTTQVINSVSAQKY